MCKEVWVINSQLCPKELNGSKCFSFQDNNSFDPNRECISENDQVEKLYQNLKGYANSQKIMVDDLMQSFGGMTSETSQFKVKK